MVRLKSHLMYEIGALASTSDRTPNEVVDDLRARHVEDELLAALGPRAAGDADRPVRVLLEQPAPLADHLGLDPEAELDAERLDLRRESVEAVRAACAGRRTSRRATSRPSRAGRTSRRRGRTARRRGRAPTSRSRRSFDLVEAEVGRLPVVDEDRPRRVAPRAAREPLAIEAVERVAHRPEPGVRVDQDRLGRLEGGARLERPGERLRADADPDPRRVEGVDLGLGDEVARVDEAEPVDLARILGRGRATERDERVVLVARRRRGRCRPTGGRAGAGVR